MGLAELEVSEPIVPMLETIVPDTSTISLAKLLEAQQTVIFAHKRFSAPIFAIMLF